MASGVPASIHSLHVHADPPPASRRRSVAPRFRVLAATVLILSSLLNAAPAALALHLSGQRDRHALDGLVRDRLPTTVTVSGAELHRKRPI